MSKWKHREHGISPHKLANLADAVKDRATPKAREGGREAWYRITAQARRAEVAIYDEIGEWGVSASEFCNQLGSLNVDTIDLRINSPGGEVFDGIAIYNTLLRHPATVNVFIDGLAASAASFIAQAGDTREMASTARLMIHDAQGVAIGDAAAMRELAALLDDLSDNIAGIYAARSGTEAADWRARMRNTTWYDASAAQRAGLVDTVTGQAGPAPAEKPDNTLPWDVSEFQAMMKGIFQ